ncbi:MAG TPA: acyltransferase [Pseudomonadales bacterium]
MKQRITWPDNAKALGILLVFWGHLLEKTFPNELAFQFYKAIYAFHIPLFFLLAGIFFRYRSNLRFGELVLSHGKSRLIPVLFFSLIATPMLLLPAAWGLESTGASWSHALEKLWFLLQGWPVNNWACWFLVCLFTLELIAFELIPFLNTRYRQWTAVIVLAVLGYCLTADPFAAAARLGISKNWWFVQEAVVALPFYLLGHFLAGTWLRERASNVKEVALAVACTAGLLVTYNLNMNDPGPPSVNMSGAQHGRPFLFYMTALLGSVAVIQWARLMPYNRLIAFIGANTLPLIGLNGLLLQFFNRPIVNALNDIASGPMLVVLIFMASVVTLLACLPIVMLFNRWVPLATGRWKGFSPAFYQRMSLNVTSLPVYMAIAATLMVFSFYVQPGTNLRPGLDSSWAYALNYIAHTGLVMGKDIYFTFGPLGFLDHPRPLSMNIIQGASLFWALLSFALFFNLLKLVQDNWKDASWLVRGLNLVAVLILAMFLDDPVQRMMMLVYVLALRFICTAKPHLLYLSGAVASISMMVKFSYGVTTFAFLGLFWLVYAIQHRNIRTPAMAGICAAVTYFLVWFAIYGSTAGSIGYLLGGLEFSRGSVSAMALNPEHSTGAIALFYFWFVLAFAVLMIGKLTRPHYLLIALPFAGPLFIWTRYAFGREDVSHIILLYCFAFYIPLLTLPLIKPLARKLAYAVIMAATLPTWYYIHSLPVFQFIDTQPEEVREPLSAIPDRFNLDDRVQSWVVASERELATLKMSTDMRARVGDATADVYPWQNLIAHANYLNWTPRPVFQNYITYTPKLDAYNAAFYNSDARPRYIVWDNDEPQDIDRRYPFSSDPLTRDAIIRWYKPVMRDKRFTLFEAQATPQLSERHVIASGHTEWNEWINLPQNSLDIVKLHLGFTRTLAGRLNAAVWKEGQVFIDYKLRGGRIVTHTLVVDNAVSGVWASPYIARLGPPLKSLSPMKPALAEKYLALRKCEGYTDNINVTGSTLELDGWIACLDRDTDRQKVRVLLVSDTNTYQMQAHSQPRPGITEHFGMTGKFNLENSGFSAVIPIDNIADGEYAIYLVSDVDGDMAITPYPHKPIAISGSSMDKHNVEALRIHTLKPWIFKPDITFEWTGYDYIGQGKPF